MATRYDEGLQSVPQNASAQPIYAEHMPGGFLQFHEPEVSEPKVETKEPVTYVLPVAETVTQPKRSRACGLTPRVFWSLVVLVVLLVVGGVVGGVVAGLRKNSSNQSVQTESSGQSTTSTTGSGSQSTDTARSSSTTMSGSTTATQTSSGTPTATPSAGSGSLFDANSWYRLTNGYLGPTIALDVLNNNGASSSGNLTMQTSTTVSGQYWQVRLSSDGKTYSLCTQFLGPNMRLDVSGITPYLAPASASSSGQKWTITGWGDGTWRFVSGATGSGLYMDTYSDTHDLLMSSGSHTGQRWTLKALGSINNATFTG